MVQVLQQCIGILCGQLMRKVALATKLDGCRMAGQRNVGVGEFPLQLEPGRREDFVKRVGVGVFAEHLAVRLQPASQRLQMRPELRHGVHVQHGIVIAVHIKHHVGIAGQLQQHTVQCFNGVGGLPGLCFSTHGGANGSAVGLCVLPQSLRILLQSG